MFTLNLIKRFLKPKLSQLSQTITSLISISVIALTVWLVLTFFSVTNGLKTRWTEQLISITAPLRITPTSAYYQSPYHQIDLYTDASDYTALTLKQKFESDKTDPFNPEIDAELPEFVLSDYPLKHDIVKETIAQVQKLDSIQGFDFYLHTPAELDINTILADENGNLNEYHISQSIFLTPRLSSNPWHTKSITALTENQLENAQANYKRYPNNSFLKHLLIEHNVIPLDETSNLEPIYPNQTLIYLPQQFQNYGISIGDQGSISDIGFSFSGAQKQSHPIFIAGFFDPGMVPFGSKIIQADYNFASTLFNPQQADLQDQGIYIYLDHFDNAIAAKAAVQNALTQSGLNIYWKVETYEEFEYTQDLFLQLKSDKTLFSLLAVVIFLVACSSIISMLIILVTHRKKDIAILKALGASTKQITLVFASTGLIIGLLGSFIGISLSVLTLYNLDTILSFISYIQGHQLLNEAYFGSSIPNTLSSEALFFVCLWTSFLSILAAIIPSYKASQVNVIELLRG